MTRRPEPPFERVAFDCDSTLTAVEGIDALAEGLEVRDLVAELTRSAMTGELPLDEVYGRRLDLVRPNRDMLEELGRRYVECAVPDAREVIEALLFLKKDVKILSGGLRPAVGTLARWLGLPDSDVFAVDLSFGASGDYREYDRANPMAAAGGKAKVISGWPRARTALVGDGMTDAEARDAVGAFICFQGVERRGEVLELADKVVECTRLAGVLPHLCTARELAALRGESRYRTLVGVSTVRGQTRQLET